MATIKAVGLLSGGLDSTLAAKLIIEQGIEVHAVNFTSPFCTCTPKSASCSAVATAVAQLGGIPLKKMSLGVAFLDVVKNPKHGYGKNLNPCIDCRIMKIRKAAEYMKEIGASFIFTGEVLGQRPMSQHREALKVIDNESGIKGYILRPLSAAVLDETIPEKEGLVDRSKLLAITGRGRTPQMELAKDKGITDYHCAAGGCLLTDEYFSERLQDYFDHTPVPLLEDMAILRVGRHVRCENGDKHIIAHNEIEGARLLEMAKPRHTILEPCGISGPLLLLEGNDIDGAIKKIFSYVKKTPLNSATLKCTKNGLTTLIPRDKWPVVEVAS